MSTLQFQREIEPQSIITLPEGLLSAWSELALCGKIPSYDGENGCWYLESLKPETLVEIKMQILDSIVSGNERVIAWNEKTRLLRELGEDHPFVWGYLGNQPGFWSLMEKGDGVCCLYGKGCMGRTAKGYLDFITPRLRELWPDGFVSNPVAYELGYYAVAHFRYASKLPSFEGVDIHDKTLLSDFLRNDQEPCGA